MSGDSGLFVSDERIGDPRQRLPRAYGGRDAKMIRRRDGRIGVIDAHTGEPLGLVISEDEAAVREANRELPAIEDDGLGSMRAIALAAFISLASFAVAYGIWHHGRFYEREHGTDSRWSRP